MRPAREQDWSGVLWLACAFLIFTMVCIAWVWPK